MLVLNASYEPLNVCTVRRALVLILKEKAEVLERGDDVLRSETMRIDRPEVIRLISFVRVPRDIHRRRITRKAVLARDGWTCQYCGSDKHGLTVDHVIPRSRGGESVWENIVASCAPCNRRKGNRLPQEIRMHLEAPPAPAGTDRLHPDRRAANAGGLGAVPLRGLALLLARSDSARCLAVAVGFGLTLGFAASSGGVPSASPAGSFAGGLASACEPDERRLGALVTFASPLPAASASAASSATVDSLGASSSSEGVCGAAVAVAVLGLDHQRHRADAVALLQVHHPDALGRAAHPRDAVDGVALHHPVLGDEDQLLALADDQRAGEAALLRRSASRSASPFAPRPLTG